MSGSSESNKYAARRVLSREVTDNELSSLRGAFEKQKAIFASKEDASKQFLAAGEAPRDVALNPADHAAMTVVCLTILNLDEALTRE